MQRSALPVCLLVTTVVAQTPDPRTDDLRTKAVRIRTLDPADRDFADLEPLADKIGAARIVVLGEATHSEGSAAAAKARLCMFLHQRLGFDVLSFEAGVLDCWFMNRALADPRVSLDRAKTQMMRGGWDAITETQELFEYVRDSWQTPWPLEVAGFDGERLPHGPDHFVTTAEWIDASLESVALSADDRRTLSNFADRAFGFISNEPDDVPVAQRAVERDLVSTLLAALETDDARARLSQRQRALYRAALIRALASEEWKYRIGHGPREGLGRLRDRAMAAAFAVLARELYPGRRIIVWAATAHLTRHTNSMRTIDRDWDYTDAEHMGDTVYREFGLDLYTIAITSHHGRVGRVYPDGAERESRTELVELPRPGSFEDLAHAVGAPFLLVDLRREPTSSWLRGEFEARPLGMVPARADWSQVVDAFLFVDEATPEHALPGR